MTRHLSTADINRFWSKVDMSRDCWEWTGGKYKDGYGRFFINGVGTRSHRVVWVITNDSIPDGLCVLHKCDNVGCVNPSHLFVGSQLDNMRDMIAKKRNRGCTLPHMNTRSKLAGDQVDEIRKIGRTKTLKELSSIYGVSDTQISRILRHKCW